MKNAGQPWLRPKDLLIVALILTSGFLTRAALADHYFVPSGSMQPTVEIGDRILVHKAAYGIRTPLTSNYLVNFDAPTSGDVVVLASPEDETTLLKRVVAGPGDEVMVREGQVWINGYSVSLPGQREGYRVETLASSKHQIRLTSGGGPDFGAVVIPEGHYLVMGDHRGNSHDGRSFGLVPRETIHGKALGVFFRGGFTWEDL